MDRILQGKAANAHAMKKYRDVEVQVQSYLTSALPGNEAPTSHHICFTHGGKQPGSLCIGRRVFSRASLDWFWEKLNLMSIPEYESRAVQPVAYSLYGLRYLAFKNCVIFSQYLYTTCYFQKELRSAREG